MKNIYVIGPESVLGKIHDQRLIFVNENEFVDVEKIRQLYSSRTDKVQKRYGWYVQQFIKMSFSRFTQDEYYLIWDSDTIPIRPVKFFDDNSKPIFDVIPEYFPSYFDIISKILPDIYRASDKCFITEHMLIKSEYMRELMNEINNNTSIPGKDYQEKIINAVNLKYIHRQGFSEFETYGNFVTIRHPDSYTMRDWCSLRTVLRFYDSGYELTDEQINWLAKKYYAVSIEEWQKKYFVAPVVQTKLFRKFITPDMLDDFIKAVRFTKRLLHLPR